MPGQKRLVGGLDSTRRIIFAQIGVKGTL